MPLERNTVRSIENFSGGTRGALSAEEFLRQRDNAWVIYFHRDKPRCKMPFSVSIDIDRMVRSPSANYQQQIETVVEEFNTVKHRLLEVPFTTL